MADDRSRAIDLALAQIEKQFGKGSIMRLGNKEAIVPISVISTGSISFDAALGVGEAEEIGHDAVVVCEWQGYQTRGGRPEKPLDDFRGLRVAGVADHDVGVANGLCQRLSGGTGMRVGDRDVGELPLQQADQLR